MILDLFAEVGNALLVLSSSYLALQCWHWRKKHGPDWPYSPFISALAMFTLAMLINALWWSTARIFSPPDLRHVDWMREYSGFQTIASGVLYFIGTLKFVQFIEGYQENKILTISAAILIIAIGVAVV